MISRYTLPEMERLWSDENRLAVMLEVELQVLAAQSRIGIVPKKAVSEIRRKAKIKLKRIQQREAESDAPMESEGKAVRNLMPWLAESAESVRPEPKEPGPFSYAHFESQNPPP